MHACIQYTILHLLYVTSIGAFCIKYKYVTLGRDPPDLFFFVVLMYDIVLSLCSVDNVLLEVAPIIVPHVILIKPVAVLFMGRATNGQLLCKVCDALKCISMNNSRLPPSDAEK